MKICLLPKHIDALKKEFAKRGAVTITSMSSRDRLAMFENVLGNKELATGIAVSFEKSMASKQKKSLIKWAEKNLKIETEEAMKKRLEKEGKKLPVTPFKVINKLQKINNDGILTPNDAGQVLDVLVSETLNIGVSAEEIAQLRTLSENIKKAQAKFRETGETQDRIEVGKAILDAFDYTQNIAPIHQSMFDKVMSGANIPRTLMSSLDLSAPFRQGLGAVTRKEFWTNLNSMLRLALDFGNPNSLTFKELKAEIISRPTYEKMKKGGLRLTIIADNLNQKEEDFMTDLISEKIPVFSRAIKFSEHTYTGFLAKLRADMFDRLIAEAEAKGVDTTNQAVLNDIAGAVNNLTGSGNIGRRGGEFEQGVPAMNAIFFSPRLIASRLQAFNFRNYNMLNSKTERIVEKEYLRGYLGMAIISMAGYLITQMFGDDEDKKLFEKDPRGTNFMRATINGVRIDTSGGLLPYIVLIARLMPNYGAIKTAEGTFQEYDGKWGSPSRLTALAQFIRGKFSPVASFIADMADGKNVVGQPFETTSAVASRLLPLSWQELGSDNNTAEKSLIILTNLIGFSASKYTQNAGLTSAWEEKYLQTYADDQEKLDYLQKTMTKKERELVDEVKATDEYKNADNKRQKQLITNAKSKAQREVHKQFIEEGLVEPEPKKSRKPKGE